MLAKIYFRVHSLQLVLGGSLLRSRIHAQVYYSSSSLIFSTSEAVFSLFIRLISFRFLHLHQEIDEYKH